MDLLFIFLPAILALGIITSIEDIKTGKIRNKWLLLALAYFMIGSIIVLIYSMPSRSYLIFTAINAAASLVLGMILWHFGIWSAGDAKLFFVFCLLIPLSTYEIVSSQYFPGFDLLANIFAAAVIFFIFAIMIRSDLKQKKEILSKTFSINSIVITALNIFAISWIVSFMLGFTGLKEIFLIMCISFAANFAVQSFLKRYTFLIIAVAILRLFIDQQIYSWQFITVFSVTVLAWAITTEFLNQSSSVLFSKELDPRQLKKGMVLAEMFSYKKISIDAEPEGLSDRQIASIRKLYKIDRNHKRKIRIRDTTPFAIFIFIGVLITIILGMNLIQYIKLVIK